MSLEDAVELTARLAAPAGASAPLQTALAGYVEARRAPTAKMVRTASANRDAKTAGPIGRRCRPC
jgi:2-polyprenyl-6-methoxyphenol hydroxylase-like FAD-dependent oxidoreductase